MVALIVSDGHILVEHRAEDNEHSPGAYRFPAGHVEPGETLEQALKREVREELGRGVRSWRKLREADFTGEDGLLRRLHYFAVELDGPPPEGPPLAWFSKADRERMSFPPDRAMIDELL